MFAVKVALEARDGRPSGGRWAHSSATRPIRFLQLSSPEGGPRRVDARPLAGRHRPSHTPPERRLPVEHHAFSGADMLQGVTPIASRFDVGQRPVVHRLQSLPRPLPGEGRGLAATVSQAFLQLRRPASSSRGSPVVQTASTAWGILWGDGPRIRSRSGGLAGVGVGGDRRWGQYAVRGRAGLCGAADRPRRS